jgi:ABC-type transport system involved in multi-copper enzyme maturation permease subunit
MTMLENSRKQIFHVLCLLILAVIAGSSLLSILTEGVKLKILKDLCMTCVLFGGAALSIALGSAAIPGDLESRTIHPIIARPVSRAQYVVGKFLGTFLTVALGVLAMSVVFGVLIYGYQRSFDWFLVLCTLFAVLEAAVMTAVATALSTVASPAITAVVSFLVYVCGTVKIGYFSGLIQGSTDAFSRFVFGAIYHALPNLECFNLKTALVHQDTVPASYLAQVAAYGVCYVAFVLLLASVRFSHKEV